MAQSGTVWSPKYARPDQSLSIFAEWSAGITFDAVRIRLPKGWTLVAVDNVDDARMNRSAMKLRPDGKVWIAEARFRLASPVRLIITAVPDEEKEASVSVEPGNLIPTKKGISFESAGESVIATVPVEDRHVTAGDALNLESAPRLFSAPDFTAPVFPAGESFSVEFWFQTVERDAVLLSTWDGNETGNYPFEFVIDAGGNLRCYSGQGGRHFSLLSSRPVADGAWHHAAYVRDVDASSASLYVDGRSDDSVYLADQSAVASYPIAIGGRVGVETPGIAGLLDELRIWPAARSAETIVAEAHLPGRSLAVKPIVLEDFEAPLPASLETDDGILAASDLALHQPVRDARVEVKLGAVEIGWRLTSGEAQTVTLERSEDGSVFVPIYLVVAGARDREVYAFDRTYAFTDVDVDGSSVFFYRFTQDFQDGSRLVSNTLKVGLGDSEAPESFKLIGNSPNPFVHSTQVFFELSETMHVRLSVWDISGHMVEWLVNATLEPGRHMVAFNADDLPSGTYFVRLESQDGVSTKKMILRK